VSGKQKREGKMPGKRCQGVDRQSGEVEAIFEK